MRLTTKLVHPIRVVWCAAMFTVSMGVLIAQEVESSALAAQLVELMTAGQLDALATQDTIDENRYVAALAFPGQLMLVSAQYEAPVYLEPKLRQGQFRDVYLDLNTAAIAGTKVLITDVGANGLGADDVAADVVDGGGMTLRIDGNRNGGQMSQSAYADAVADADQQYARMLRALIAAAQ